MDRTVVELWQRYVTAEGELSILENTEVFLKTQSLKCASQAWKRRHFWRRRGCHFTIFGEHNLLLSTTHQVAIDPLEEK